jgi:hypothetical protein
MTVAEAIHEKRALVNRHLAESSRLMQQPDCFDQALSECEDAIVELRYLTLLAAGELLRTRPVPPVAEQHMAEWKWWDEK